MSVPHTKIIEVRDLPGGENSLIVIPAPPRGQISRLIVKQIGGALDGYEFDLYDRASAVSEFSGSSESGQDQTFDDELHQIVETSVVAEGEPLFQNFDMMLSYVNQDSMEGRAHRNGAVYMRMLPGGTTAKDFQIAITTEVDVV